VGLNACKRNLLLLFGIPVVMLVAFGVFSLLAFSVSAPAAVAALIAVGLISVALSAEFTRRWRNCG
jgi:hypothetical protein